MAEDNSSVEQPIIAERTPVSLMHIVFGISVPVLIWLLFYAFGKLNIFLYRPWLINYFYLPLRLFYYSSLFFGFIYIYKKRIIYLH